MSHHRQQHTPQGLGRPIIQKATEGPYERPDLTAILMWFAFVAALGVFVEPISGLVWLAIGILT